METINSLARQDNLGCDIPATQELPLQPNLVTKEQTHNTEHLTLTRGFVSTQLPIFIGDLRAMPRPFELAAQAIQELQLSHPESTPSNVKAHYMSPWKSHLLNANLGPLCTVVINMARIAARGIMGSELSAMNMELVIADCWAAIYHESDLTSRHNHFPAEFAAVAYLEAAQGCAPIVFAGQTAVQPHAGMVIIFPGILDHEVPPTNAHRTVVALNLYKRACFS